MIMTCEHPMWGYAVDGGLVCSECGFEKPDEIESLRMKLAEEKHSVMEILVERLEELSDFELGRYQGEIAAYDDVLMTLRNIQKYG